MKTLLLAASILVLATPAIAQTCPKSGENAPLSLHRSWIMTGWQRNEGDPPFVFAEKMKRYYDLDAPSGVFYDNFAPGPKQLFNDAAVYGANWEELQNGARSVVHALTDGDNQIASDSIASTTIGFVGQINRVNGEVIAFDARSQLGWVCTRGEWKIRQEMNYAWVVKPQDIAHRFKEGHMQ